MEKKKLKVLVFNWQDLENPLAGGAEVHLHEVFERMASRGHEVTLYCHHFDGAKKEEIRNGIRIVRQGLRSIFNFYVPFAYWFKFRKEQYDIIVDDVNKIPFYTPLFVKEPVQGVTHHLFGKSIFLETVFPFALYVHWAEKLIKPIYRHVHFIIGSPSTHKEYLEWGFPEEQVTVVNYCVNKDVYYHDESNAFDPNRVGYFGRLKKYKSVDHFIEAFAVIKDEYPDLKIEIIGDGDDKPRLESRAKELGVENRVIFHGFIDEEEKAPLLQKMNFVVNTSSKEGWGLTVVEANACGAPVIAANVQGLRDSVVDGTTGMLYPYADIQELANSMRTLLDSPERRNSLRKGALDWAASFDWEIATDRTLELMYRTIENHKARTKK
ncbi:MAG: hypothetical protein CL946_09545 [Ectothiorhodospiraceae bacterium]|nr:hypothetical protein [Ectothiorhodospiraceae bacterium]